MSTTIEKDTVLEEQNEKPGMQLAKIREKMGYSHEYVAGQLNLRVKMIELIESDSYDQMPEPVFIKGYLRAYANLLGVSPEPLLALFNRLHHPEKKLEKALWQNKRTSHYGESIMRWLTGLIVVAAVVTIGVWWQKNRETQPIITAKMSDDNASLDKRESEIKLTDLSKMQAIFSHRIKPEQITPLENDNG